MNENLNLVEILKDCPKGTKLYSTVFGEVKFMGINENAPYPIIVKVNDENFDSFTADGKILLRSDGECTLFPSKEQRDWSKFKPKKEGFVPPCEFKDGDILSYQCGRLKNRTIYIYRYHERFNTAFYVALSGDVNETFRIDNKGGWSLNGYNDTARFATEEEKQKLFDAIKENGYKWNAETKTLEKLIKSKFDPKTLDAFDKILVKRGYNKSYRWVADFVTASPVTDSDIKYCTMSSVNADMVIPYNEETKHLVGTTEEAPEYYRYWEE